MRTKIDLGARAEAAKAEPKNIRAEASRNLVEPKLQNVTSERAEASEENSRLIFL